MHCGRLKCEIDLFDVLHVESMLQISVAVTHVNKKGPTLQETGV